METNCVQQVKPLAARSAACFFTRAANSVRGKCSSDLLNRLATCTIGLPSCGQRLARLPARNCSPTSIIGGHSFYFRLQEPVLDTSDIFWYESKYIFTQMGADPRSESDFNAEARRSGEKSGERRIGADNGGWY